MPHYMRFVLACAASSMAFAFSFPAFAQAVPASPGASAPAGTYLLDVGIGSILVDALVTTNSSGHATAISGLVNGTDPITGLSTYAGADNNLYVTGSWVTFAGLSFSTTSLGDFNFYNSGQGYYGLLNSVTDVNGYPDGQIATAGLAPVPEPSSWAMLLIGFAVAGAAMRRTRKKTEMLPQFAA